MNISFDMNAYHYSEGIKALRLMFVAASDALKQHLDELQNLRDEYETHLDAGGDAIGEWEDGTRLWDQDDLYRLQVDAAETALYELRAATLISLFHMLERSIPPANKKSGKHRTLSADAPEHQVPLHPDLDALRFMSNYLKDGTNGWLSKLAERWPLQFGKIDKPADDPTWVRRLPLEDQHVDWCFEIAKFSERPITRFGDTPE